MINEVIDSIQFIWINFHTKWSLKMWLIIRYTTNLNLSDMRIDFFQTAMHVKLPKSHLGVNYLITKLLMIFSYEIKYMFGWLTFG